MDNTKKTCKRQLRDQTKKTSKRQDTKDVPVPMPATVNVAVKEEKITETNPMVGVEVKKEKIPDTDPSVGASVTDQKTQETYDADEEEWWANNIDEVIQVWKTYD